MRNPSGGSVTPRNSEIAAHQPQVEGLAQAFNP